MSLKYTLTDKRGYLLVTASGCPDCNDEMFQYIDTVFREIRHRGYPSVLVDETQANLRFDILDAVFRVKLPSFKSSSMQIVHMAMICAPHSVEQYKFFEGVFDNDSFRIKAFDNLAGGEEWLKTTTGPDIGQDMAYSYHVIDDEESIRINLSGELNEVNDMLVLSGEMIREATAHDTTCILLYGRDAQIDLDISQAFKIAQTLGDYIPLLGLRIASVPSAEQMELDQFFETVFQNRSINYRVFESIDEAKAWLKTKKYKPLRYQKRIP